jgi:catechol 2,3-dioxygenase-like lactoylglutathione lyase family enzyme
MNVADLDRSIDFYSEIFGFSVLARRDQLAAVGAPESERPQVIVFRTLGATSHPGGRSIGVRALMLEIGSLDELEQIAHALDLRGSLVGRRSGDNWTSVVGHDPDRIAVVATSSLGPKSMTLEGWANLDEILYGLGE